MTEPNKIKNKIIQHTQKQKGGIFHPLGYVSVTKQTENYYNSPRWWLCWLTSCENSSALIHAKHKQNIEALTKKN